MTAFNRLCIVHLPSPSDSQWRHALGVAATEAGWAYVVANDADVSSPEADKDVLISCVDARLVAGMHPTTVIVMGGAPEGSITSLMAVFAIDYDSALKTSAQLFAYASELVAGGAEYLASERLTAVFPGLGEITREPDPEVTERATGGPLSFYAVLSPAIGGASVWPLNIFNWMDGPTAGRSDLTGRQRLLQYGPYLTLSRGEWSVDIRFALALDRSMVDLRFEWGTDTDVDVAAFSISKSGVYSTTLTKFWPSPATAEVRIWLDRAMFDGSLQIEEIVVRRSA